MKIHFVKSHLIGSRIIQWGLEEPASHVVVEFPIMKTFYHSYLQGVRADTPKFFSEHYVSVAVIDLPLTAKKEMAVNLAFLRAIPEDQHYDYGALGYFAYRAALRKFLGIPLPKQNPLQKRQGYLCTEVLYALATAFAEELAIMVLPEDHDYSIVTPWQLYKLLVERMQACGVSFGHLDFSQPLAA